ncbi:hypothetical protein PIB30_099848 [Stylosanthes scabra]|uniref:DUF4283 domain-containing protein n=1 Tax=Stylosanthes scabra TaxID=79078 RepID=A0ABU6VVR6_9FABA|nr:hypothetical protein [Stylosanthes scabra]
MVKYLIDKEIEEGEAESARKEKKAGHRRGSKKERVLEEMVRKHVVKVLGVVEMKMNIVKAFEVKRMWGNIEFEWESVPAIGNGRGIILVWEKEFQVTSQVLKGDIWICVVGVINPVNEGVERTEGGEDVQRAKPKGPTMCQIGSCTTADRGRRYGWEPKPFRSMDVWFTHPQFKKWWIRSDKK